MDKGSSLEFRKEAFKLFEDLLSRTKVETIKFLFNLNIVIENKEVKIIKMLEKREKFQGMILVLAVQVKNINIAAEGLLK